MDAEEFEFLRDEARYAGNPRIRAYARQQLREMKSRYPRIGKQWELPEGLAFRSKKQAQRFNR